MFSQLTHLKSDPLDVLLFAVGLRLTQLAKSKDEKFTQLLENRDFTIQLGSDAEKTARTYTIKNGVFSQQAGEVENPTLTINFKDSMTGVKLLTKGDATAFMKGIQSGDLKMSGDYSLIMWFNQISKFIVPKVPEQLKPVVEQVKPLLEKALPMAQGLFSKVMSTVDSSSSAKQSKYFNADNTKSDDADSDGDSKIDTLKAKATELKDGLVDKVDELKTEATEKLDEVKTQVTEKLTDVKDQAAEKAQDVKEQVTEKAQDVKEQVAEKVETVKTEVADKVSSATEEDKADDAKADKKAQPEHEDEIIASNVQTDAVKSDDSPITNITVTRHEHDDKADSKSESGKPAIVVQDKDGNAYKSK